MQEEIDLSVIELSDSLNNVVERLLLSEAVSDIDVIFLGVDEKHVFKRMDHVLVTGSDVFISPLSGKILRYNRDGKFINAIGNVGQGPFDIYSSCGIALDPSKQKLQVLTQLQDHKIVDFYPDYVNERQWIARYEVSDLKEKIDIEKLKKQEVLSPGKRDKLVKILEDLADDDNPVLIVATLK